MYLIELQHWDKFVTSLFEDIAVFTILVVLSFCVGHVYHEDKKSVSGYRD